MMICFENRNLSEFFFDEKPKVHLTRSLHLFCVLLLSSTIITTFGLCRCDWRGPTWRRVKQPSKQQRSAIAHRRPRRRSANAARFGTGHHPRLQPRRRRPESCERHQGEAINIRTTTICPSRCARGMDRYEHVRPSLKAVWGKRLFTMNAHAGASLAA
jgi:hypothetical protein